MTADDTEPRALGNVLVRGYGVNAEFRFNEMHLERKPGSSD